MLSHHSESTRLRQQAGFTLIEISLVIALMLGLCAMVGLGASSVHDWNKGKEAGLGLQAVHSAQRSWLADHPTSDISNITSAQIISYLPQGWSAIPVATGLQGETLTLDFTTMPPRWVQGSSPYDPSNSPTDGLWDPGN